MGNSGVLVRDADPAVAAEPSINIVPATLGERIGRPVLTVCGQQVAVPALLRLRPVLRRYVGRPIVVGIRPAHLHDAVAGPSGAMGPTALVLHTVLRSVQPAGADWIVRAQLADGGGERPAPTLVARLGRRPAAVVGAAIMLAVDLRNLLVLDASKGRRLW